MSDKANEKQIASRPVFFKRNRVFRVYLGGAAYKAFTGEDEKDCFFPEEWIASTVKAINPKYFGERDGVSVIDGTDIFFDDLVASYPDEILGGRKYDCLVKFLDSAIRLPVQVHPTKEFSKKHFGSPYGKTEAWLVLATRENAKIHFGFRDKITYEQLSEYVERSENEKNVMESLVASVPARVGDTYLIHAGLVHAIGAGCTILEVQEPTDFTIQPEYWCGDWHLSDKEMYISLNKQDALSCFDLNLFGDAAIARAAVSPKVEFQKNGVKKENLITYADTPCFAENRYTVTSGRLSPDFGPAVWIVTAGEGTIEGDGFARNIKKGDYFFLPHAAENKFFVTSEKEIELVECLPSLQ